MSNPSWHIGNTTVRNPLRIKDGLEVLKNPTLNGNLIGGNQEKLLAYELHEKGVINLGKQPEFFGRKWRACFTQLGFITDKFKSNLKPGATDPTVTEVIKKFPELNLTGLSYELTSNGLRMINAETVQEQQECMLRSLAAYEIPSIIEKNNGIVPFKPFIFILQILKKLKEESLLGLSFVEMGIVQSYRDHGQVDSVIRAIVSHREEREKAVGRVNKRNVDKNLLKELGDKSGVQAGSIRDYADVNFRYPRLTGLVSHEGKRLVLNKKKMPIIDSLINDIKTLSDKNNLDYLAQLWNGSKLPTDDELTARQEIDRFQMLLQSNGVSDILIPDIPDSNEIADINQTRMKLESMYHQVLENQFASSQSEVRQIKEIIAYLKKLDKQKLEKDDDVDIEDEPAYLEWAVWRAFLSIDNLVNEPYEARRFKVDQDFLPMGTAPGGGPDLIFEFEDYVLVVEVTLTTSSRQEAAEGEPVRRHVADEKIKIAENTGKPVYGLFIARSIDNNTAETFRIGVWYNGDEPDFLNIVPLTLEQFIQMMEKYLVDQYSNRVFRRILDSCLIPRNAHAPAWKKEIKKVINQFIKQ